MLMHADGAMPFIITPNMNATGQGRSRANLATTPPTTIVMANGPNPYTIKMGLSHFRLISRDAHARTT